jgi:hypothetical protein
MRAFVEIVLIFICLLSFVLVVVEINPVTLTEDDGYRERVRSAHAAMMARHAAVDELLADRITLSEAAARFRETTATDLNEVMPFLRQLQPGRTDAEIYHLHVLMYLKGRAIEDPQIRERIKHWEREIVDLKAAGALEDEPR